MPTYIEPFDFQTIFLNYFIGTVELFIFAFVLIYSYAAAKYQMSNRSYLIILAIGSIMFAGFLGQSIYVLVLFSIGTISYFTISQAYSSSNHN